MPKGENSFKAGNPYQWQANSDRPLAEKTVCFKPFADQYEKLKALPNLSQRMREVCDKLLEELATEGSIESR